MINSEIELIEKWIYGVFGKNLKSSSIPYVNVIIIYTLTSHVWNNLALNNRITFPTEQFISFYNVHNKIE